MADDLDLLIRECGGAGGLIIDVSELAYVDRASARALLGLRGAGARLVGCSPFIELCLERADRGAS